MPLSPALSAAYAAPPDYRAAEALCAAEGGSFLTLFYGYLCARDEAFSRGEEIAQYRLCRAYGGFGG